MKLIYPIALAGVLSILLSCNGYNTKEQAADLKTTNAELATLDRKLNVGENEIADFAADTAAFQAPEPGDDQKQKQTPSTPVVKPDWDKKIIKTATLNAEVKDYGKYYSSLHEKVKGLGGYIAEEQQTQSEYKIENTLMIKVPVDQFDEALAQLTSNTEKINEKKVTSQDVTTEVIDTKSRMEAKKQVRLRYMDLLKQAKNMQEILSVQSEINGIQEDIESATGRIGYLNHSSAYSTINLTYFQILNATAKDDNQRSFGTKLISSFRAGGEWVADLFIGLVTIWPLFLLIGAGIIVYKRTKRTQAPKQV